MIFKRAPGNCGLRLSHQFFLMLEATRNRSRNYQQEINKHKSITDFLDPYPRSRDPWDSNDRRFSMVFSWTLGLHSHDFHIIGDGHSSTQFRRGL